MFGVFFKIFLLFCPQFFKVYIEYRIALYLESALCTLDLYGI